jgi:hypothetical protein
MNLRRNLATAGSTLVIAVSYLTPAIAAGGKRDDGDEPGVGLTTAAAILWFVLLPIAISAIIAVLVLAPGWTKGAKDSAQGQFLDDPTRRQIGS